MWKLALFPRFRAFVEEVDPFALTASISAHWDAVAINAMTQSPVPSVVDCLASVEKEEGSEPYPPPSHSGLLVDRQRVAEHRPTSVEGLKPQFQRSIGLTLEHVRGESAERGGLAVLILAGCAPLRRAEHDLVVPAGVDHLQLVTRHAAREESGKE
jgi:hypothetical protein